MIDKEGSVFNSLVRPLVSDTQCKKKQFSQENGTRTFKETKILPLFNHHVICSSQKNNLKRPS